MQKKDRDELATIGIHTHVQIVKYSDYSSGRLDLQAISQANIATVSIPPNFCTATGCGIEAVGRLGMIEAGGKGLREAGNSQGAVLRWTV